MINRIILSEKFDRIVISLVFILTLSSFFFIKDLKFDFSLEKFFPADDPDVAFYYDFQKTFNSKIDDEAIFIVLENSSGIFQKEFLGKTHRLTQILTGLKHVEKVYSLTNSNYISNINGQFDARPVIHINQPELYFKDSINLFQSPEFRTLLVSKDGKSLGITAFNTQNLSGNEKDELFKTIKSEIKNLGFDNSHLASKFLIERAYIKEIEENFKKYLLISLLIVGLVLFLFLRSINQIVISFIVIIISILWTLALISGTGNSLDVTSSLIPPVIAAISMSGIIHFNLSYKDNIVSGLSPEKAIIKVIKTTGIAMFFASFTTATGFFTLSITNILPISNFGVFTGIGVLISFILTVMFLAVFFKMNVESTSIISDQKSFKWDGKLNLIFNKLISNRKRILFSSFLLLLISIYYISKIKVDGSLLKEIPENSSIIRDYHFIENEFYGTRSFEIFLERKDQDKNFLDLEILSSIDKLESFFKDSCHIGYVISPGSLFKGANKAYNSGRNDHYKLPDSQASINQYMDDIMQTQYADEMNRYMADNGQKLRISGRLPDLSIVEFAEINKKIERYFERENLNQSLNYKITGSPVLLDKITYYLIDNLIVGLLVAFLVIALISIYLLKSWNMILISVFPNLIAIIVIAGIMGFLGIFLKADTAVVFAISFGIAVDNTIHFMSRLKIELNNDLSLMEALRNTYLKTGKTLITASIVIMAGFSSLLFSSFNAIFYIGFLISVGLLTALILNLTLLPILILKFYKKN